MFRRIVVGFDGTESGRDALALAQLLAETTGAELILSRAVAFGAFWALLDRPLTPFAERVIEEEGEPAVEELREAAAAVGGEAVALRGHSVAETLESLAEDRGAGLIVVGSSHRGRTGQAIAGSIGMALLSGSKCPVAVAPKGFHEPPDPKLETILVGFDGREQMEGVLAGAYHLAKVAGADLRLLAVPEPPPLVHGKGPGALQGYHELDAEIERIVGERLDEAVDAAPAGVEVHATMIRGEPYAELASAGETADLLVLGSRCFGPLRRVLLGSVSRQLARSAPCPLLVFPRGAVEEPESSSATQAAAGA